MEGHIQRRSAHSKPVGGAHRLRSGLWSFDGNRALRAILHPSSAKPTGSTNHLAHASITEGLLDRSVGANSSHCALSGGWTSTFPGFWRWQFQMLFRVGQGKLLVSALGLMSPCCFYLVLASFKFAHEFPHCTKVGAYPLSKSILQKMSAQVTNDQEIYQSTRSRKFQNGYK
eukprot:2054812-Amphidinium_carterae.1